MRMYTYIYIYIAGGTDATWTAHGLEVGSIASKDKCFPKGRIKLC